MDQAERMEVQLEAPVGAEMFFRFHLSSDAAVNTDAGAALVENLTSAAKSYKCAV